MLSSLALRLLYSWQTRGAAMQFTPTEILQNCPSHEELVNVLTNKYGMSENQARALDPCQLRIQIAALNFLANNLPLSSQSRDGIGADPT
jgi:hypothetical protein